MNLTGQQRDPDPPAVADEQDVRLLEAVRGDHEYDDRFREYRLGLGRVLRAASLTGRSPADVAARLPALAAGSPTTLGTPWNVREGIREGGYGCILVPWQTRR